jgi:hypothetical protein
VEPRIVLEVTFDRVQPSSRHNSGYALRFPRIVRVRSDKPPEEIDTLETVRRLAETLASEPANEDSEAFVDSAAPLENASTSLTQESNQVSDGVELENNINQTPTLEAARDTFKAFVDRIQPDKSVVVVYDSDADGVTAGVVLQLALSRAGFDKVKLVAPDRQRNAWTPANRERVIAAAPDRNVALVRINSPCQIHPLIAQSWRTRLPKYIVMVANEGYIPGRVNFSVRTASGINVLDFLKSVELSPGEGSYGHGHDSASGGSLPVERWNELLSSLGFEAKKDD